MTFVGKEDNVGAILDELLEAIDSDDLSEQLRQVCDQIAKEEIVNLDAYDGPSGANVFLSLPAYTEAKTRMKHYVCLEREAADEYIITHWIRGYKQGSPLKRLEVWVIIKEDTTSKILKRFVEQLKFVKGE